MLIEKGGPDLPPFFLSSTGALVTTPLCGKTILSRSHMSPLQVQLKEFWRRLSLPDLLAAGMVLIGALLLGLGKSGSIPSFLRFVALLCAGYLAVRFIGWWRSRLLWSLRNRLIVAYLFIALVPVLL